MILLLYSKILLWLNLVINTSLISIVLIDVIIKIVLKFFLHNLIIDSTIALLLKLRINLLVMRLLPKLIVLILIELSLRLRNQNISWIRINSILRIWIFLICFLAPLRYLIWINIISNALFSFRHISNIILGMHIVLYLIMLVVIVLRILVDSNLHF